MKILKNKICIVQADYYPDISAKMIQGVKKVIPTFSLIKVPGVFEIPAVISKYIDSFDGFIALGCVIKGETPHFNFISKSSIDALMELSIKNHKPIGNGIITCLDKDQALKRADPNDKDKGGEAAKALLSILKVFSDKEEN